MRGFGFPNTCATRQCFKRQANFFAPNFVWQRYIFSSLILLVTFATSHTLVVCVSNFESVSLYVHVHGCSDCRSILIANYDFSLPNYFRLSMMRYILLCVCFLLIDFATFSLSWMCTFLRDKTISEKKLN